MIMTSQLDLKNNSPALMILSEEEQFQQVCALLEKDVIEALKLANFTLRNKKYFQDLLERGLEVADASEIEIWLKYLVPRLGMRYVINVLEGKLIEQPQKVDKAMYWLPKFLNRTNERDLNLFKNLENKILELTVSHVTV